MLIDYLDWGFWCNVFFVLHCYTHLGHWHADCDDWLSCLSYIVTLILPWLFCSPRMYRLIVVYHLTWCVASLACILSWSSLSMLYLSLFILIVIARMWTWVVYSYFVWLYVAWLPPLCDCMPLVYVGRTSIHLLPTLWFRSFLSSWLSLLQVWGLVCVCFSVRARG